VIVNWGPRGSRSSFKISGKTLTQVRRNLDARGEWGKCDWSFTWKTSMSASGTVSRVRLTPQWTVLMPAWTEYRRAKARKQESWDQMWKALLKHENGHGDVFERGFSKLERDLAALESPSSSDVDQVAQRAQQDIDKAQRSYDTETDHGRSRGVELPNDE